VELLIASLSPNAYGRLAPTPPNGLPFWREYPAVKMAGSEPYYFGSYVSNPNLSFAGSTWEIRCGGNVCAHGYGRTIPRAVRWLASRLGG
jgi:hypothetical protein